MWYSTDYAGKAIIEPTPTAPVLVAVNEAIKTAHEESAWALSLGDDFSSIVWRWCEKTYDFEKTLNAVEDYMRNKWFDFTLNWEFEYQWEDNDDRWFVRKVDWKFVKVQKTLEKDEYKCPDCGHIFKPLIK